jgi:hypothetical protein
MKFFIHGVVAIIAVIGLSGCANKVHDYAVSTENLMVLKSLASKANKVNVGEFTDSGKNEKAVMCRLATPIGTPKGETFASYIKNAFQKELLIADLYDPKAKNTISANVNDVYGSTVLGNAYWSFDVTVKSSNGKSYNVKSRYDYESSFSAMSACSEMQRSFPLAVQKLIGKIITHPKFVELTK